MDIIFEITKYGSYDDTVNLLDFFGLPITEELFARLNKYKYGDIYDFFVCLFVEEEHLTGKTLQITLLQKYDALVYLVKWLGTYTLGTLILLESLDLTGKGLPEQIYELCFLQVLKLDNNDLSSLSKYMSGLKNLHTLSLNRNNIHMLPREFVRISKLRNLYIDSSHLKYIDTSIFNLTTLRKLHLKDNDIVNIPDDISKLVNLESLYLHYNNIKYVSPKIGQLKALIILSLSYNYITTLPDEIIGCDSLQELYIGNNHLLGIPEGMLEMPELRYLFIENNPSIDIDDIVDINRRMRERRQSINARNYSRSKEETVIQDNRIFKGACDYLV